MNNISPRVHENRPVMEIGSSKLDPYKTKEPFFVGAQLAEPELQSLTGIREKSLMQ